MGILSIANGCDMLRRARERIVPSLPAGDNVLEESPFAEQEGDTMTALLLSCCLTAAGAPLPAKGPVMVLAGSPEYRKLALAETTTDGVIERISAGSRWAYRLKTGNLAPPPAKGRAPCLMVYAPGKAHLLEPFIGKRVWATGKVDRVEAGVQADGQMWLARIEPWSVVRPTPDARGVFARSAWHPNTTLPIRPSYSVIRDGAELARLMRIKGESASDTATTLMARRLGVTGIDWKKHMLVSISAGLKADADRLTVTSAAVRDGTLIVAYRLSPASRGGGFGYPVETVLVNRFSGLVRVSPRPTASAREERKSRP